MTGRKVDRSVDALSLALLADEALAKNEMEKLFVAGIPAARAVLTKAFTSGMVNAVTRGDVDRLGGTTVVGLCAAPVEALIRSAVARSAVSVKVELEAVETNLGRRYDGLASVAVDKVMVDMELRYQTFLERWAADMAKALVWFEDTVEDDWRAVASGKELYGAADERLFSARPIRLPGHSGQGSWWRLFQSVFASAKAQEFIAVNEVRVRAIGEFNDAGVALRDG